MCFSATASFAASAVLITAGGASLSLAKPHQRLFAAMPLLFGIQQAIEGLQWLQLDKGESSLLAGYGFLFFAYGLGCFQSHR